jgi:uncharacterized protein YciI
MPMSLHKIGPIAVRKKLTPRPAPAKAEKGVKWLTQHGREKRLVINGMFVTHGGVVLGFALQEAARAAQVLALLTSFRSCLRIEYLP